MMEIAVAVLMICLVVLVITLSLIKLAINNLRFRPTNEVLNITEHKIQFKKIETEVAYIEAPLTISHDIQKREDYIKSKIAHEIGRQLLKSGLITFKRTQSSSYYGPSAQDRYVLTGKVLTAKDESR